MWDASTGATTRITDGNDDSSGPAISADGRYVTYVSEASDLVPDDTNGQCDVFRWDASTGTTIRVTDGNDLSTVPAISADGRYVTYFSQATNLVPDDANGYWDVFVWDATTGATARITDGDNHSVLPAISADGRYIAYTSYASALVPDDSNGAGDVFVWDAATGTTTRLTDGNDNSLRPSISADGRYVTYNSHASNLVPDDSNGAGDVFVWDATTGTTTRITDGNADSGEPAISADGHHVTYNSYARSGRRRHERRHGRLHVECSHGHHDPPHKRERRELRVDDLGRRYLDRFHVPGVGPRRRHRRQRLVRCVRLGPHRLKRRRRNAEHSSTCRRTPSGRLSSSRSTCS